MLWAHPIDDPRSGLAVAVARLGTPHLINKDIARMTPPDKAKSE